MLLEAFWNPLIETGYSFVVKDGANRIIGVALNYDANDEPQPDFSGALRTVLIFLHHLEEPVK